MEEIGRGKVYIERVEGTEEETWRGEDSRGEERKEPGRERNMRRRMRKIKKGLQASQERNFTRRKKGMEYRFLACFEGLLKEVALITQC